MIELEWDQSKRRANLRKHGLDFEDVQSLEWDEAVVMEDTRFPYPESRFWAFARMSGRYHVVTFCLRGPKVRIISFRKANEREVGRYGKQIDGTQ